jgi:Tfp pilus assembly PilM family ATPase
MVMDQSKFLERIGTAQMEQQMQQTVLNLAKEQNDIMKQQSGVESSMTENEVKDYLQNVLKEVKKTTNRGNE